MLWNTLQTATLDPMVKRTKPQLRVEQSDLIKQVTTIMSQRYGISPVESAYRLIWNVDSPRVGKVEVSMWPSKVQDASDIFGIYFRVTGDGMLEEERKAVLTKMWEHFRHTSHEPNQFSGKWNVMEATGEEALKEFRFKMDWLFNDQA